MADQNHLPPLAHRFPKACERLGIGKTKMYEEIAEGRIKPIKVGSRTLIPESELKRYIQERMKDAAA